MPKKLVKEVQPANQSSSRTPGQYLKEKLILDLDRCIKSIAKLELSIANHAKELQDKKDDLNVLKHLKDELENLQKQNMI